MLRDNANQSLDAIQLLNKFVENVCPYVPDDQENPAVTYWKTVVPILSTILENFSTHHPICECVCKTWRRMFISYRTAMAPLLPEIANKLAGGFESSREGCFLWVTEAILREFSSQRENVSPQISESIYQFFEAQTVTFLRIMTDLKPRELPDVIEDFFNLLTEAVLYYPHKLLFSSLLGSTIEAATYALVLEQREPIKAILWFLRDVFSYGTDNPARSNLKGDVPQDVERQFRGAIVQLLNANGDMLVKRLLAGLVFNFDPDCYSDTTGVISTILEVVPQQGMTWLKNALEFLPPNTVAPDDATRLLSKVQEQLQAQNMRQVRIFIDGFASNYRRRHVAPREGLGEAARFKYEG